MDVLAALMFVINCVLSVESSVKIPNVGIAMCRYRCKVTGGCKSITFISTQLQCYLNFDNIVTEDESSDSVTRIVNTSNTCRQKERLFMSGGRKLVCEQATVKRHGDYTIIRTELRWHRAGIRCRLLHGQLALMDTPQKVEDVKAFLTGRGKQTVDSLPQSLLWIGMRIVGTEFTWLNNKTDGFPYKGPPRAACAGIDINSLEVVKLICNKKIKMAFLCEDLQ